MDKISNAVIEFAQNHLESFKIRNGQIVAEYCPFCHGGDHNDKNTFAIGLYNGAYQCMRGGCEAKGSFRKLKEHFGEVYDDTEPTVITIGSARKTYDKPDPDTLHPLTDEIVTYMGIRKISEETLEAFKIASDDKGNMVFPFYRNGELVYVKYRKPKAHRKEDGPKEWQMANTEPILFGMDNVSLNKPLVITEGEIDALSLYEAGVSNVVSVPCGCKNTEWVNICWDWLEQFQQIILFGDSDEPGVEMMQSLVKRLGEDRCMIAPQYPDLIVNGVNKGRPCKDANEILFCYGPEALSNLIDACAPAPIQGVLNLASISYVDPSSIQRIYTRIPSLDQAIGGFAEGGLTVISGKRGEGKSTISGIFLLNAIQQGYNVAAYSGELSAANFLNWIMCQACERRYMEWKEDPRNGKRYAFVPMQIQDRIRDWIDNRFFLFDNTFTESGTMVDALIRRFTMCARRYGCKLFLVDNLMMMTSGIEEEFKAQAKITAALKQFAVKFNAHVILVAHPRKRPANQVFDSEDISGSAAISNLADIVMAIEKPNINVTKNREFGETPKVICNFDPTTRRIFQASTGDRTIYGWNHDDLISPEHLAAELDEFAIQSGAEGDSPF